jgi:hypothetical protein
MRDEAGYPELDEHGVKSYRPAAKLLSDLLFLRWRMSPVVREWLQE